MNTRELHAIVNAVTDTGWYVSGQKRLKNSLIHHGSTADNFFNIGFLNNGYDESCPYNIKASILEEAVNMGYKKIMWLDASVWAIKNPMPLWDVINEQGYYFWKSGYNCAQVCSDKCLEYFGVTRDEAEGMLDCSTSMFGFNLDNPVSKIVFNEWLLSAKNGMFSGSRFHDSQSSDPRFLFHRNDQSCMSLLIGKYGLKMHDPRVYSAYYDPKLESDTLIFFMQGI